MVKIANRRDPTFHGLGFDPQLLFRVGVHILHLLAVRSMTHCLWGLGGSGNRSGIVGGLSSLPLLLSTRDLSSLSYRPLEDNVIKPGEQLVLSDQDVVVEAAGKTEILPKKNDS